MQFRGRFFGAAAIAALIAAGGCSHAGGALPQTAGSSSTGSSHASDVVAATSLFHANSEKYRDTGSHPVTGRSGSAVVQGRALLAKDGTTLIEATTGTLDAQPGSGNFRHVTVTPTTVDGNPDQTQAYNNLKAGGYWNHTYTGLARNETVKVDSNITDLDPRTDVVTTIDTVKKRPDLSALKLAGPAKAYTNQPVTFTATVSELNGDVGAHADCILSADGQQVDQSLGIWVDAAGTVSCSFQTSFATTGIKHLTVSVANVVPGDWDTSNNSAQTTIEIVDPIVKLQTSAWAYTYSSSVNGTETYSAPWANQTTTYSDSERYSNAYISAYSYDHQFAFPAQQASAVLNVDGSDAYTYDLGANLNAPYQSWYETCQSGFSSGAYMDVCSGSSWTDVWVELYGSQATYYSKTIGTQCSYWGCSTYSWVDNNAYADGRTFTLGATDVFSLNLTDNASTKYIGKTQPAAVQTSSWNYPYNQCWSYGWYYDGTWCDAGTDQGTTSSVYAYGSGT